MEEENSLWKQISFLLSEGPSIKYTMKHTETVDKCRVLRLIATWFYKLYGADCQLLFLMYFILTFNIKERNNVG